jgi:hypothetical protein
VKALIVAVALGAVWPTAASAYPHYQLSSGSERCDFCHYALAGGGLLNEWGQGESADTLGRGGDGRFLHGLIELPDWVQAGGELRVAGLVHDTGESAGARTAVFPMQADALVRFVAGSFSLAGSVGLRGSVRSADVSDDSGPMTASASSPLISREHYVQWEQGLTGRYARAGRFFAPHGLRLHDHTAYVRRYLGFNLLEETYGVSAGQVGDRWEVHAAAFVSDRVRWAPRDYAGGSVFVERHTSSSAVGASARVEVGDVDSRAIGGLFGKLWSPGAKILWWAQIDVGRHSIDGVDGGDRLLLAAYAGPVWVPVRGLYLGAAYELYDEDLQVEDVERHAVSAWVSLIPRAHFELMSSLRLQLLGPSQRATTGLLQFHYRL